jgi:hypothetical protein
MRNILICACLLFIGLGTLCANPVTDQQVDRKVVIEKIVTTYSSQIGVRELTGNNDGVQVEAYLKTTGFTKGAPWCAAFLSWTFIHSDVKAIQSAWAPAWFPPLKTIYEKGRANNLVPERSDIGGLYSPQRGIIFHVFFIDDWPKDGDYVITVEGNTNNAGSAEGDGVYRKRRFKTNISKISRWT